MIAESGYSRGMGTIESQLEPFAPNPPLVQRLGLGAIGLIVANTLVLYLYFFYDVTLFQLVLVYWCECVWIGLFSAIKLIVASIAGAPYESRWVHATRGGSVLMSFLLIGFAGSAFISLLGIILMMLLWVNGAFPLGDPGDESLNHFGLVFAASSFLMAAHGISLVANFILRGEYKNVGAGTLLVLPFKRCFALLFAIFVSIMVSALFPTIASTSLFAVMVIFLKVVWDIGLHFKERRMFAESITA